MKHSEFMTALTDCYGPYKSELLEKITFKYIKERFNESELEAVFGLITIRVNPKFRTPPCHADFEEFFPRESLEAEANKWYNELSATGNSLDNVMIPDIRAYKAIQSFGGWADFCQRNPDYEGLHRKNFVENFIKYSHEKTEEQPRVLYGESTKKFIKAPLMFGNKELCQQLIELSTSTAEQAHTAIENMTKGMRITQ